MSIERGGRFVRRGALAPALARLIVLLLTDARDVG
jgi:hypothetical protein